MNEGDAIYVDGVFIGYMTQRTKSYNFNLINLWKIYVDRSIVYDTGKDVSTATKHTHDLYLTNGEHLHGSKYISLVHPVFANGSPTFFNSPSNQTITTTVEKYGLPLYKLNHIEKGNYRFLPSKVTRYYDVGDYTTADSYYINSGKVGYYASAYKTNHGNEGSINARTTETSHEHLAIENRGYEPASGSLFFDYNIFESGHSKDAVYVGQNPTMSGYDKSR